MIDDVEWAISLDKHGLDMADFAEGFDFDTARQFEAYASRTGRTRFALIGWLHGRLIVVATMSPLASEALSLVSLRLASTAERALHGSR